MTLICINLFEYFLLVSPPLKRVPIPNIRTTPTAIKRAIDRTLTIIFLCSVSLRPSFLHLSNNVSNFSTYCCSFMKFYLFYIKMLVINLLIVNITC